VSLTGAPPAPWYFRYRVLLISAAYVVGFFAGNRLMPTSAPVYALLGGVTPAWFGVRGSLGLIVLVTLAGTLWRIWGASYLSSTVVHSWNVHTSALYVGGPYRFTRNPLYFGCLCWALALGAYGTPLAMALVFFGNLAIFELLIRTEEAAMFARFGAQFAEYCAAVPRLVPLFFRSNPPGPPLRPDWRQGLRSELFGLAFVAITVAIYLGQQPTVKLLGVCLLLLIIALFVRGRPGTRPA
jgi:protein-S-isoprenylcysteine O-methyltransferase Ste14